jgi:hypothetical protein
MNYSFNRIKQNKMGRKGRTEENGSGADAKRRIGSDEERSDQRLDWAGLD